MTLRNAITPEEHQPDEDGDYLLPAGFYHVQDGDQCGAFSLDGADDLLFWVHVAFIDRRLSMAGIPVWKADIL